MKKITEQPVTEKDTKVNIGTKIINVGDEDELFAIIQKLGEIARVVESLKEVTVARWVPSFLVTQVIVNGHQGFPANTRIAALLKHEYRHTTAMILPQNLLGILVCVKGVHEHQRHSDIVFRV